MSWLPSPEMALPTFGMCDTISTHDGLGITADLYSSKGLHFWF